MVSPIPASSKRRQAGCRGDQAFGPHAGFGQSQVKRVIAAGGQVGVDIDQVANAADFGGENDLVGAQSVVLGSLGGFEGTDDHGLHHHFAGGQRLRRAGVLVHHAGEEGLVERAPVDADADRFLVLDRALDHDLKVVVVFLADGGVAGIDAVLRQRTGRGGEFLEQEMAVVMEVADDGHVDAALFKPLDDVGNGGCGVFIVDRHTHDFRAGQGQGFDLLDGARNIRGVGIGHRLHDDRDFPAHPNLPDFDRRCLPALNFRHGDLCFSLPVPRFYRKSASSAGAPGSHSLVTGRSSWASPRLWSARAGTISAMWCRRISRFAVLAAVLGLAASLAGFRAKFQPSRA